MNQDIKEKKLSERQLKTLADLKRSGVETTEGVIDWCNKKLSLPRRHSQRIKAKTRVGRRAWGKAYYQGIIDYLSEKEKEGGEENAKNTNNI